MRREKADAHQNDRTNVNKATGGVCPRRRQHAWAGTKKAGPKSRYWERKAPAGLIHIRRSAESR